MKSLWQNRAVRVLAFLLVVEIGFQVLGYFDRRGSKFANEMTCAIMFRTAELRDGQYTCVK